MKTDPSRITGTLLGLAAGDRIGGPIQMALTLAESLVACRGFDTADLGQRYLAWWRESGFDTGPTAAGVFRLVQNGTPYHQAARIINHELEGLTAGCNPLHRCPPLALSPFIPEADLVRASKEEARLTHFHPTAGEGAALITALIRSLIRGSTWKEAVFNAAKNRPDWILNVLFSKIPPRSTSGYTPDVLQAALYFLDTSGDFLEALERSLEFAGPANYCPVLVGSLGGARWGAEGIPPQLLGHNQHHLSTIDRLSDQLIRSWKESHVQNQA